MFVAITGMLTTQTVVTIRSTEETKMKEENKWKVIMLMLVLVVILGLFIGYHFGYGDGIASTTDTFTAYINQSCVCFKQF